MSSAPPFLACYAALRTLLVCTACCADGSSGRRCCCRGVRSVSCPRAPAAAVTLVKRLPTLCVASRLACVQHRQGVPHVAGCARTGGDVCSTDALQRRRPASCTVCSVNSCILPCNLPRSFLTGVSRMHSLCVACARKRRPCCGLPPLAGWRPIMCGRPTCMSRLRCFPDSRTLALRCQEPSL